MPNLVPYKGLQLVNPPPTGDGGLAIQQNFQFLADLSLSSNVPNTNVYRDGNGDFAANVITGANVTSTNAPSAGTDCTNKTYVDNRFNALGSMASQSSTAVSITGGTIDGVAIGSTTPATFLAAAFISSNGDIDGAGNLNIAGSGSFGTNVNIGGTVGINGSVTMGSTLNVSSDVISGGQGIFGGNLTVGGTVTFGSGLSIASGGTGATTATAAFGALSPLSTTGDLLTYSGGANVRLGIGTTGQFLTVVGGLPAWTTPSTLIGGSITQGQVAYGDATANSIDGSSTFTFSLGNALSVQAGVYTNYHEVNMGNLVQQLKLIDNQSSYTNNPGSGSGISFQNNFGAASYFSMNSTLINYAGLPGILFGFYSLYGSDYTIGITYPPLVYMTAGSTGSAFAASGYYTNASLGINQKNMQVSESDPLTYYATLDIAGGDQITQVGVGVIPNFKSSTLIIHNPTNSQLGFPNGSIWVEAGSVVFGSSPLSTAATDGFVYMPGCAGAPTGVPTLWDSAVPTVIDTVNKKLMAYIQGDGWVQI